MIGSRCLAHEPLITLVEHMSLKELWLVTHGIKIIYGIEVIQVMALDHFGRIHEPKRTEADSAWYKDMVYLSYRDLPNEYYFKNDLLGERRPITQQQYQDENFTTPS